MLPLSSYHHSTIRFLSLSFQRLIFKKKQSLNNPLASKRKYPGEEREKGPPCFRSESLIRPGRHSLPRRCSCSFSLPFSGLFYVRISVSIIRLPFDEALHWLAAKYWLHSSLAFVRRTLVKVHLGPSSEEEVSESNNFQNFDVFWLQPIELTPFGFISFRTDLRFEVPSLFFSKHFCRPLSISLWR